MIEFIKSQLLDAAGALGVDLAVLDPAESLRIRREVAAKFCAEGATTVHWSCLRDYAAVQHPEAWRWLEEFVGDEPVFLLPDASDESAVFAIGSGRSTINLLGECSHFVFYIADGGFTYLVCENQHDFLFGAGGARAWVESLHPRHEAWAASLHRKEKP